MCVFPRPLPAAERVCERERPRERERDSERERQRGHGEGETERKRETERQYLEPKHVRHASLSEGSDWASSGLDGETSRT